MKYRVSVDTGGTFTDVVISDENGTFTIGKAGAIASKLGHEEGLIFRAIGDQLALCPPMIVTAADIAEIMDRMSRTMDRLTPAIAEAGLS